MHNRNTQKNFAYRRKLNTLRSRTALTEKFVYCLMSSPSNDAADKSKSPNPHDSRRALESEDYNAAPSTKRYFWKQSAMHKCTSPHNLRITSRMQFHLQAVGWLRATSVPWYVPKKFLLQMLIPIRLVHLSLHWEGRSELLMLIWLPPFLYHRTKERSHLHMLWLVHFFTYTTRLINRARPWVTPWLNNNHFFHSMHDRLQLVMQLTQPWMRSKILTACRLNSPKKSYQMRATRSQQQLKDAQGGYL